MKSRNVIRGNRPTPIYQPPAQPEPPKRERSTLIYFNVAATIWALLIGLSFLLYAYTAYRTATDPTPPAKQAEAAKKAERTVSTLERAEGALMLLVTGKTE